MYRQGLTTGRIAALCGAAQTTVRYHLQIAARTQTSLRDDHRAARAPAPRLEIRSRRNLHDVLALYRAEQRLPRSKADSRRERTLHTWLVRRRQESANGNLSPTLKEALDEIPGWDPPRRQQEQRQALWHQRLTELTEYRAAGNDWPLHKKTSSEQERVLGVWLHSQRMTSRKGTLRQDRRARLDAELPGWLQGRPHRGGRPKRP